MSPDTLPPLMRFSAELGEMVYFDTLPGEYASPPLFMVHGLPTAKELWLPVVHRLPAGVRCIIPDLHDYGGSARVGRPISFPERARSLEQLRHHLQLERIHLVAHDLGASIAVDYLALAQARVSRLVMISPPVYPDFVEPEGVRLLRRPLVGEFLVRYFLDTVLRRAMTGGMVHPERYDDGFHRGLLQAFGDREGRAALLRNLRWGSPHDVFLEYPAIMHRLQTPTLVIQGRQDPYIPASQAERLANHLDNGELLYIEDGAHFLPLDTPEPLATAVTRFLGLRSG